MAAAAQIIPFGEALARGSDPITSHEAAASVRGAVSARLYRLILWALSRHPEGLICSEIVVMVCEQWNTISPRLKPMRKVYLIHDSGEMRTGPSGRRQIVWKLGRDPLS
jgi:hypothetical protein